MTGVVNMYLNSLDVDFESKRRMRTYIQLLKKRADGKEEGRHILWETNG